MPRVNRGGIWYEIDSAGRAIPATPRPTPSTPAVTDDIPRVGRKNSVLSSNLQKVDTILDWRSDDAKARAVRLMVGRPDRTSLFGIKTSPPLLTPGETYLMYPVENDTQGILAVGTWIKYGIVALVEFGVEGYTDQFVIDAVPAQSINLVASFIRVIGYNNSAAVEDIEFQACVIPDNGHPTALATMSVSVQGRESGGGAFLPGGEARVPVPRFAKAVRVTRTADTNTPGGSNIIFNGDTLPDPGVSNIYSVRYDYKLPEVLSIFFGATSNAGLLLSFEIQP